MGIAKKMYEQSQIDELKETIFKERNNLINYEIEELELQIEDSNEEDDNYEEIKEKLEELNEEKSTLEEDFDDLSDNDFIDKHGDK